MIRTKWLRFLTRTISAWGLGPLFILAVASPAQGLWPVAFGDCPGGIQTGDFTLKAPGQLTTGPINCSQTPGTADAYDIFTYGCYNDLHLIKAGGSPPQLPLKPHFEIDLQGYCSVFKQHVSKTPGGQWGYGSVDPTQWTEVVIKGAYDYHSRKTVENVFKKATGKLLLGIEMECPKNPWAHQPLTCGAASIKNPKNLPVSGPFPLSAAKVFYMKHSTTMVFGQHLQQWEQGKTLPPEMETIKVPLVLSPAPSQVFTDSVLFKLGVSPTSGAYTFGFYFDRKEGDTWVNKKPGVRGGVPAGINTKTNPQGISVPKSAFGGPGMWRLVVGTGFSFSPPRYFCIDISPCLVRRAMP